MDFNLLFKLFTFEVFRSSVTESTSLIHDVIANVISFGGAFFVAHWFYRRGINNKKKRMLHLLKLN